MEHIYSIMLRDKPANAPIDWPKLPPSAVESQFDAGVSC